MLRIIIRKSNIKTTSGIIHLTCMAKSCIVLTRVKVEDIQYRPSSHSHHSDGSALFSDIQCFKRYDEITVKIKRTTAVRTLILSNSETAARIGKDVRSERGCAVVCARACSRTRFFARFASKERAVFAQCLTARCYSVRCSGAKCR